VLPHESRHLSGAILALMPKSRHRGQKSRHHEFSGRCASKSSSPPRRPEYQRASRAALGHSPTHASAMAGGSGHPTQSANGGRRPGPPLHCHFPMGDTGQIERTAVTYGGAILDRLLIDLSRASCHLEQHLLPLGRQPSAHPRQPLSIGFPRRAGAGLQPCHLGSVRTDTHRTSA